MSTLQQSHDLDLESANSSAAPRQVSALSDGGGPVSSKANEIVGVSENNVDSKNNNERRESNASECSVEIVDLETGEPETKLYLAKTERDCRICHLSMDTANQDFGVPIELGCSCKDDLAAAHKQCAEAWFKIKGNKTCEICGSIAQNVAGVNEAEMTESWNETQDGGTTSAPPTEVRNFWKGHRFLNFLLACMVFAFVISWLFRFNVPS